MFLLDTSSHGLAWYLLYRGSSCLGLVGWGAVCPAAYSLWAGSCLLWCPPTPGRAELTAMSSSEPLSAPPLPPEEPPVPSASPRSSLPPPQEWSPGQLSFSQHPSLVIEACCGKAHGTF